MFLLGLPLFPNATGRAGCRGNNTPPHLAPLFAHTHAEWSFVKFVTFISTAHPMASVIHLAIFGQHKKETAKRDSRRLWKKDESVQCAASENDSISYVRWNLLGESLKCTCGVCICTNSHFNLAGWAKEGHEVL
jgi:hypothetical protein